MAKHDLNDPKRLDLAAAAARRMEQMLLVLLAAAAAQQEGIEMLMQGMLPRMLDLNSIVMSAAGDDSEDPEKLERLLDGAWCLHA